MASSTTSLGSHHRRRQSAKRQPLSRTNTLFGAIKNIVTAPLSWFASTDDFEDTRDSMGKRRRLAAVPTEPALDEEEKAPRTKRMRMDSPPRELQREGAYLEPPPSMFQQPPSIGRSVSTGTQASHLPIHPAGATGNYVRSTLSPLRNLSISRTMSIDPPPRPQSRDGGAFQSQRPLTAHQDVDSSMESVHVPPPLSAPSIPSFSRTSLSMPRDLSMPHSRPAFRMRTSLTPQPAQIQRERSEPPPLQLLRNHPTFVKAPPSEEGVRTGSTELGPTLGSLVDSVRRTQSPARQHSSLLFGSKTQAESKPEITRAQRALHELEIYKTPLLPTRLRNGVGQASITGVPDLFKPRRKLVLMKDEQRNSDRKLGRKEVVSPDKNGTKPYAGEGGMKKMLAKRKLELEEGEEEGLEEVSGRVRKDKEKDKDESMEEEKEVHPPVPPKEVPLPLKDDWYSLASSSSTGAGGSSLRVGRAKSSRNHISRPTARSRAKFSAVFEDDGDDAMIDQDKDKEMLEEAAKKAPIFNIPAGFSFARDMKPIEHDTTNAKEPPIKSLPFSFSAAPKAPLAPVLGKTDLPTGASHPTSSAPPTTSLPLSFGALPSAATPEKSTLMFGPPPTIPSSQPSEESDSKGGIPNFFARSAAFNKPLEIKTAPLIFSSQPTELPESNITSVPIPLAPVLSAVVPPSDGSRSVSSDATSLFGSPAPGAPVKDVANPLWDGEKKAGADGPPQDTKKDQPQAAPISIFGAATQAPEVQSEPKTGAGPASSFFGGLKETASPKTTFSGVTTSNAEGDKGAAKHGFMFGPSVPASTTPSFSGEPDAKSGPAPSQSFNSIFGGQASTTTALTSSGGITPSTSGTLFNALTPDVSKPTPSPPAATSKTAIETEKPANIFGTPASSAAITNSYSFGQPSRSDPAIEAPKPVVSNGPFSFGATTNGETKSASPAPFSFGAQDSKDTKSASPAPFAFGAPDKETKPGSPAPFTFGAPSTPQAAEKVTPFTFGTPSASPVPPPIFTFGAGGSTAGDVSKPLQVDRPATPPKNNDQEFKMEESPTRDIQQSNNNKSAFGGFTFGNAPTSGSVLFGGPTSAPPATTAPFPFGSTPSPNPFAPQPIKESKSEGPKPFSFGQSSASATSTGFPFGQAQPTAESPRPSTTGSFNFAGPGTPTSTASGFNFGAPPASNPFGQPSSGSAPSSPSTFQSTAFNFGAPSNTAFTFGSQPASPAAASTNLPQTTTPVTFGGASTGFGSSAPSSPFNPPTQIAPSTSSGGTLFTIGAAPPPQAGGQSRVIKKLPNRNRTKR